MRNDYKELVSGSHFIEREIIMYADSIPIRIPDAL